jgi:nitrile hydratase accessory protein
VTDGLAREVQAMPGATALPRANGELTFDAPWQGRVFGVAIELTNQLGLPWDDFRRRLIAAIDADDGRTYYESWLVALESLVTDYTSVTSPEVDSRAGVPTVYDDPGMGTVESFAVATDEDTLLEILTELFVRWWESISFGPLIQGAVYEIQLTAPPTSISTLDGYVTISFDHGHFHLCIGRHRGIPGSRVSRELAWHRRCARAELYRVVHDDAPVSWGFRMYNGLDEQQLTVHLPNPFLDNEQNELDEPDWSRLACWDRLRHRFLALTPDERDRSAPRFHHG